MIIPRVYSSTGLKCRNRAPRIFDLQLSNALWQRFDHTGLESDLNRDHNSDHNSDHNDHNPDLGTSGLFYLFSAHFDLRPVHEGEDPIARILFVTKGSNKTINIRLHAIRVDFSNIIYFIFFLGFGRWNPQTESELGLFCRFWYTGGKNSSLSGQWGKPMAKYYESAIVRARNFSYIVRGPMDKTNGGKFKDIVSCGGNLFIHSF